TTGGGPRKKSTRTFTNGTQVGVIARLLLTQNWLMSANITLHGYDNDVLLRDLLLLNKRTVFNACTPQRMMPIWQKCSITLLKQSVRLHWFVSTDSQKVSRATLRSRLSSIIRRTRSKTVSV